MMTKRPIGHNKSSIGPRESNGPRKFFFVWSTTCHLIEGDCHHTHRHLHHVGVANLRTQFTRYLKHPKTPKGSHLTETFISSKYRRIFYSNFNSELCSLLLCGFGFHVNNIEV